MKVNRVGLEPTTHGLKGSCSTNWATGSVKDRKDKAFTIIFSMPTLKKVAKVSFVFEISGF